MRAAGPDSLGRLLVSRLGAAGTARQITVQDLVDTFIPYHHVRSALGLTMKGEYDLGVLHLLHSGEYVRVDAELAKAVERELASPEPDLAFLSDLREARVEVRPEAWVQWSTGPVPPAPGDGPARRVEEAMPEGRAKAEERAKGEASAEGRRIAKDGARARDREGASGPRSAAPSERCRHCQRILPERSDLQFCPYCGVGQADPTCADCDEPLERGWAYCPRCGKATEK